MARLLIAISLLGLLFAGASEAAQKRVALVVGAAAYAHAPRLAHSLDDARGVAAALQRLGFDVDLVLDPDRASLETAVRRLGKRAEGAEASLFYYSGHALEAEGANWIAPVSADVSSARDLRFETLDLAAVLEQMKSSALISLVFLDACRDDPFKLNTTGGREATRGGLAEVNAAVGSFVAFATAPGMVAQDGEGPHSPFTAALLSHIETPGLEIRALLSLVRKDVREATSGRQIPWDASSLEGEFYFKPAASAVAANEKTSPPAPPQIDGDALFWDSIRNSKNPRDFDAYLAKFPNGVFAELARNRLIELGATPSASTKLSAALSAALAAASPATSERTRAASATGYIATTAHKALALFPPTGGDLRVSARGSGDEAEQDALEACEVLYGGACALIAVDDEVKDAGGGAYPTRDMRRVRYVGRYDPSLIPSVRVAVRQRSDVAGYANGPSPKAIAYHPEGLLFVVRGAASQNAAEQQALSLCNDDPARNGRDGPCYLYAVDNDVVLAKRSKQAITPPATGLEPSSPPTVKPAPAPTDAFSAGLEGVLSTIPSQLRDNFIKTYQAAPGHKAIGYNSLRSGVWRVFTRASLQEAEDAALEGCEAYYADPCALVAADETLLATPDHPPPPQAMARNHYAGSFDPDQIPAILPALRVREDIKSYAAAPAPKAAAFHPWGAIYIFSNSASQNGAETDALAACNKDPIRKGQGGPCYLYASGDNVVFPKRLQSPLTPPASQVNPPSPVSPPPPLINPPSPVVAPGPPSAFRYAGDFNADRIPFISAATRGRLDVVGYGRAAGPKAMALNASGRIGIVTNAHSQQEAEARALSACGSECYLYAVSQATILGRTLTQPRPLGNSLADALSYLFADDGAGKRAAEAFQSAKANKAYVVLPDSGAHWSWTGAPTAEVAEQYSLETCQIVYHGACAAVAVNDQVIAKDPSADQRRDMPRVSYAGDYKPSMVPTFDGSQSELSAYQTMQQPKAMALRPGRRIKIATGATLAEAETKALASCNDDESPFPCFLYAANEKVVLPQRRTEAQR